MDIRTAALVVGIGLAAFKIVSACVVYLRTQTFGSAGVSLVGGGVLLMMLSMWSATTLTVAEQGAEGLGEVQRDVAQLHEASKSVSQQLLTVAQAQALSRKRTDELVQAMERRVPSAAEDVHRLDPDLASVPPVDLNELQRLSRGSELSSRRALERRQHRPPSAARTAE